MCDEIEIVQRPVFDRGLRIIGYLSRPKDEQRHRELTCVGMPDANWQRPRFVFNWQLLCASRAPDEIFECWALVTDTVVGLDRLLGFKWFAEVHGTARIVRR